MANRFIGGVLSSQQPSSGGFVSRASTGTYFNNTGTLVTAPINQPRLNYSFNGNPISTRYSAYFNGSAYLTATMTAFGTNPFTIECWFYLNSIPTVGQTYFMFIDTRSTDTNGSVVYVNNSGVLYYGSGANYGTSTGQTLVTNRWYHVAVTRASGTTTCWLNGASVGTTSDSSNLASTQIRIGTNYTAGYNFNTGYISNARIVSGVAVYTGAFTVPTNPLTATQTSGTNISAITGTQTTLLTCQNNAFTDFSASPLTVTNTGVSSSTFLPPIYTSDFSGTGWYNPAVLVEPPATNLITYSTAITSTNWSSGNAITSVTLNSGVAPDGTTTATLHNCTGTGTASRVASQQTIATSVSVGQWMTKSVFMKSAGQQYMQIIFVAGTSAYYANFDLINGTVTATGGGVQASIVNCGNGWYRCIASYQYIAGQAGTDYFWLWCISSGTAAGAPTSTSGSLLYSWGAQAELNTGSFIGATSFIPTVASTVTRAQDDVGPMSSGIYTLMALENQTSIDDQATVQSFTTTGSSTWTCPVDVFSVEVLVVAGGGGGGSDVGAGGGGGGVVYNVSYPVIPGTTYPIVVGAGGAGQAFTATGWSRGGNSQFGSVIAYGGGGGGSWVSAYRTGQDGGSGGGSYGSTGGQGVAGQGYQGGSTGNGGGGGAGGPGSNASVADYAIGTRAPGLKYNITGSLVEYGYGGAGSNDHDQGSNANGTANTGGGGDGGGGNGYSGGSGIVVVKYKRTQSRLTATSNAAVVTQKFSVSNTWTAPAGVTQVEILVVGGGGGGGYGRDVTNTGSFGAGGGGAGGLVYNSALAITPGTSYTVTVGAGGAGSVGTTGAANQGSTGSNSTFSGSGITTITAYGGGGGGGVSNNGTYQSGLSGGSGGGAGAWNPVTGVAGTGTAGQGSNGGAALAAGESGGGGGGAGQAGQSATAVGPKAGDGGAGLPYSITGNLEYYAGGGAGSSDLSGTLVGRGGIGGGGGAGSGLVGGNYPGLNGAPNTGGGGGGGGANNPGGNGGSGVVILRYRVPTIATFQDSGSWTCPAGVTSVQALIVGGGGSGSGSRGASNGSPGGGAGGVVYSSSVKVTPGVTYPVIVGQGGIGISATDGYPGQNSSFAGIVAYGGGGGNGATSFDANRFSGGSGGGAGETYTNGQGVYGQGNAGGSNTVASGTNAGAGGGGAGGAGVSIANGTHIGGNGGPGLAFTISGTSTYYGGGGGGSCDASSSTYGTGGIGGGGNSTVGTYTTRAGTPNTGGGGGGAFAGVSADSIGGFGGSGIVIIRYYGG
jgi:hypothetical protein